MLKRFYFAAAVAGMLFFGIGMVTMAPVTTAVATEKEKMCEKCGHVPSAMEPDCPCSCHKGQQKK